MGRTPQVVTKHFNTSYSGEKSVEVELFTWEKLDYVDTLEKSFWNKLNSFQKYFLSDKNTILKL